MRQDGETYSTHPLPLYDVVVIGAGISGLSAATALIEEGLTVLVLDKGLGVGGRMATRRASLDGIDWVWDHGAQFIRFRSPLLQNHRQDWQKKGLIDDWLTRLPQYSGDQSPNQHPDEAPRFKGVSGMTTLPKAISQAIQAHPLGEIHCQVRVTGLTLKETNTNTYWQIDTETQQNEPIQGRSVLLTAPAPQSLELLQTCPTLPADKLQNLAAITYLPCISLMLGFESVDLQPFPLLQQGALQWTDHPVLGWFGDNHQKGISTNPAWTLQANGEWSRTSWDSDDDVVQSTLLNALHDVLGQSLPPIAYTRIMRWRYSIPLKTYPAPYCCISQEARIWIAGDAFENPQYGAKRIEGAYLSGQAAAQAILKQVRPLVAL